MRVIITIPAYNEEKSIGKVIHNIKDVMEKTSYNYNILVYNDGSTDKTVEVAQKAGALVKGHPRNLGLAQTFREEMHECVRLEADIIVHTDADGQYDPHAIPKMIKKVEDGYDLVLASRFKGKIESMPIVKRFGNWAFSKVISSLTKTKITDSTTGCRAFTKDVAKEIHYINTFTYTQEQIIRAAKQKFKITEIPVNTKKTRESRLFSNPFEYAIRAWINIFRIYRDYDPIKFFGSIGLTLFIPGFILGIYVSYLHFSGGIKGHIGLLFLLFLLLTVGLQVILFGFLADMLKK